MWDLSSLTRDRNHIPCIGRRILNLWTTREVPLKTVLFLTHAKYRDVITAPFFSESVLVLRIFLNQMLQMVVTTI